MVPKDDFFYAPSYLHTTPHRSPLLWKENSLWDSLKNCYRVVEVGRDRDDGVGDAVSAVSFILRQIMEEILEVKVNVK
jgi:hypothetical protein